MVPPKCGIRNAESKVRFSAQGFGPWNPAGRLRSHPKVIQMCGSTRLSRPLRAPTTAEISQAANQGPKPLPSSDPSPVRIAPLDSTRGREPAEGDFEFDTTREQMRNRSCCQVRVRASPTSLCMTRRKSSEPVSRKAMGDFQDPRRLRPCGGRVLCCVLLARKP